MRRPVHTEKAPAAVGPYSQAIVADGWVWTSGQIPLDPKSGALVGGGIEAETRQVLANLLAVLEAAGAGPDRVVRATIYLVDLACFDTVNRIWAETFPDPAPARACVQVSALPKGARIEVEAVARV